MEVTGLMVLLVAPAFNASGEGLVVPFISGKHVGAVMDTKNRHLICILQILKELFTHKHKDYGQCSQ